MEAIEEVGLANAITEGRKHEFVGEDEVMSILEGKKRRSNMRRVLQKI